jgi:hypothetical protein
MNRTNYVPYGALSRWGAAGREIKFGNNGTSLVNFNSSCSHFFFAEAFAENGKHHEHFSPHDKARTFETKMKSSETFDYCL